MHLQFLQKEKEMFLHFGSVWEAMNGIKSMNHKERMTLFFMQLPFSIPKRSFSNSEKNSLYKSILINALVSTSFFTMAIILIYFQYRFQTS